MSADEARTASGERAGAGGDPTLDRGSLDGPRADLVARVSAWYSRNARDLPWRRPDASAWGVLVSELMLQQTPVSRVLPVYESWLARWPVAPALAAEAPGEAVRAWGRLGYPRRALRLHAAATMITGQHSGRVPDDPVALRALPGVGDYTAAAVAAFAYGRRTVVLDTNVRRVLGRVLRGEAQPVTSAPAAAERKAAERLLPAQGAPAATWSVAAMELGALVCTLRNPGCAGCPAAPSCRWLATGRPPAPAARSQPYAGTDRQVRGLLLALLRDSDSPVPRRVLDQVWPDPVRRERALAGLVSDGLAEPVGSDAFVLPGTHRPA